MTRGAVLPLVAVVLLATCVGGSTTGVRISLRAEDGASRPQFAFIAWSTAGVAASLNERFPASGEIVTTDLDLGVFRVELDGDRAGDRQVYVRGMRDGQQISSARARVPWMPGLTQSLTLTLRVDDVNGLPSSDGGVTADESDAANVPPSDGTTGESDGAPNPPPIDTRPTDRPTSATDGAIAVQDARVIPTPPTDAGVAPRAGALVVHWKFDEGSGTVARDESGLNNPGMLSGTTGPPTYDSMAPMLRVPNPTSLAFDITKHAGVELSMPLAGTNLPGAQAVTFSAWFRATTVKPAGAEIVTFDDAVILRLHPKSVSASSRIDAVTYKSASVQATATDGRWHHVGAVYTSTGVSIMLDGGSYSFYGASGAISYVGSNALWVGRKRYDNLFDFEGNIDDVRIYTRALTNNELKTLATGVDVR